MRIHARGGRGASSPPAPGTEFRSRSADRVLGEGGGGRGFSRMVSTQVLSPRIPPQKTPRPSTPRSWVARAHSPALRFRGGGGRCEGTRTPGPATAQERGFGTPALWRAVSRAPLWGSDRRTAARWAGWTAPASVRDLLQSGVLRRLLRGEPQSQCPALLPRPAAPRPHTAFAPSGQVHGLQHSPWF